MTCSKIFTSATILSTLLVLCWTQTSDVSGQGKQYQADDPQCPAFDPCQLPPCWDPVQDPNDPCCKKCPNGKNCRAPDGKIIAQHGSYSINSTHTCNCGDLDAIPFGQQMAVCYVPLG
ncbi:uncharacterized protein LOC128244455 [Mya arenaria]|uniref:uncharacterized protein LOC128244455 n=1 Tax=Mya arenaria TaxID=6604 RepID=UPI0022E874E5|nr:uncharacterized protein LOC128244455 [Mya arenaria]